MSDARWSDPREHGERDWGDERPRVYDERDDHDPRDALMHDLDLPRGDERELVVDRGRVYELNGEDSRTLAAVGTFRVVPEQDLDIEHDTLGHLRAEGLVEAVDLGRDDRGLVLTKEGRDLLDSHTLERDDEAPQAFHAGVSRPREVHHDSNLYATYRQEQARLRDEHGRLEIRRVALEQDLKREYQEFLQEHNRGRADGDGRPDRDEDEIQDWAREHDLPYFDGQVVEGILAFAERILPRASDLWVQASLDYKQRLQQLFFPEGIAYDGNRFNRTAVTAPLFKCLPPDQSAGEWLWRSGLAEP